MRNLSVPAPLTTGEKVNDLENDYERLYRAALEDNWENAESIRRKHENAFKVGLDFNQSTVLHIAVGKRINPEHFPKSMIQEQFLEKLLNKMLLEEDGSAIITRRNSQGYTALSIAAAAGNLEAAKKLLDKMPSLLFIKDDEDNYPVHVAAMYTQRKMFRYLFNADQKRMIINEEESGIKLLIAAIDAEFYDIAREMVKEKGELATLRRLIDGKSALGCIAEKKSTFVDDRPLWKRHFFPRFLTEEYVKLRNDTSGQGEGKHDVESQSSRSALRQPKQNQIKTVMLKLEAEELVKELCQPLKHLNFTEAQAIYGDALMKAAELGIHEVVRRIIKACPGAVFSLSAEGRSVFHVAVRSRSESVFDLLYTMEECRSFTFSNMRDYDKNNLLHLAAYLAPNDILNNLTGAALQMQRELQWYKEVENFVHPFSKHQLNAQGKTPGMIFTEEHMELKKSGQKWMKGTASSCSITAALIAAIMFAAAMKVPGGTNSSTGYPILSYRTSFVVFAVADVISLFTCTTSILMFLSILTSRYAEDDFLTKLPNRMTIGLTTLFLSIVFLMIAYTASLFLLFCNGNRQYIIPVSALASLHPLLRLGCCNTRLYWI